MLRLIEDKGYIQAMITAFVYNDVDNNVTYAENYVHILYKGQFCIINALTMNGFTYVEY